MGGLHDEGGCALSFMNAEELAAKLAARRPGESLSVPKSEMSHLPPEFSRTLLGTPLWIAHPGAVAQYRASPAKHAYELEGKWEFHRDRCDPHEDPVGHFFLDAPELPIATACAGFAGLLTYLYLDGRENDKKEEDRNPWFPVAVAAGVALAVWVVVYIIAALVRVGLSVG